MINVSAVGFLLSAFVCEGFAEGPGEAGEQREEVRRRDPPAPPRVSSCGVGLTQQQPEGRELQVIHTVSVGTTGIPNILMTEGRLSR